MSATRNSNRIQRGRHSERIVKVAATLFLLMGLASAQCTRKCTFDSSKVNFGFKTEIINDDAKHDPYKPRSTPLPVADAISFTSTDIRPTNAGTGGCPNSFTTLSFTYPGGKGNALEAFSLIDHSHFTYRVRLIGTSKLTGVRFMIEFGLIPTHARFLQSCFLLDWMTT